VHNLGTARIAEWSPDGSWLATASETYVAVYETGNWKRVVSWRTSPNNKTSLIWSPDGHQLTFGVRIWDARTMKTTESQQAGIRSPNGEFLAAVKPLRWWKPSDESEVQHTQWHPSESNVVTWSPNGKRLATGDEDGYIRIWDQQSGLLLLALRGHTESVTHVEWSPDGRRIASLDKSKTVVRIWDAGLNFVMTRR
jgi:WD40 repeat protein